jgi:hypothetical protein
MADSGWVWLIRVVCSLKEMSVARRGRVWLTEDECGESEFLCD